MTSKPIYVFLQENGIAPTPLNKKRWQNGWTLQELRDGKEFVRGEFEKNREAEIGPRNKNNGKKNEQFTDSPYGVKSDGQMFISLFFHHHA